MYVTSRGYLNKPRPRRKQTTDIRLINFRKMKSKKLKVTFLLVIVIRNAIIQC